MKNISRKAGQWNYYQINENGQYEKKPVGMINVDECCLVM
jgi:hypothetical protein